VITPSACPVVTGASALESRSKRTPSVGSRSWSSWKTSRRFAASTSGNAARPGPSPSAGRVLVSAQQPQSGPPPPSTSQLHAATPAFAQRTGGPCAGTATIVRSARE